MADHDGTLMPETPGRRIPPDLRERIFDPFFSTKGVGQGLGLGLSISYGIINSFGGAIVGRNVAAGGAEFIVTLLAAEESKAA